MQAENQSRAALEGKRTDLNAAKKAYEDLQAGTVGAARRTDEYRQASANARANIQQLSAEIKQQSRALKESEGNTRSAQQAENALSAQHAQTSSALIQARSALDGNNAALSAGRDNLRAMGIEATNLAQAERNLQGAVVQVRQEVAAMAPAYQQAAAASNQSTQVQAQNQRTLSTGMADMQSQLQRIQQIATVALGGSYAGGLAKSVAATADEFKNLEARVKLATGEGENFTSSFAGVQRVALSTNTALDETATLFARLAKTGQEAGQSAELAQQNALQLTETINQAIQLSGGSAESAKAAITQLIQGLQSGVVRGEEFNSMMEQAPRLSQAMANGLGVTTGELRKMAEQGALTSDVVMKALRGQADVVAGEFSKLPATVGRALQNLTTQWTLYVGASDNGLVSSANAATVINTLASNLDGLVTALSTAGKLWAAMKIAGLAEDFGAWALKTLGATAAVEKNTIATVANTAAQAGNAAAQATAAAAQTANTAATVASTAARTANAASWASIGTFAGQATKATQAATAATAAGAAAAGAKSAALGLMGGAMRGVTGLLGGPVGLIATLFLFRGEITSGIKSVFDWGMSFTEAGKKLKAYEDQQKKQTEAEKLAAEARKEGIASQQRQNDLMEAARNKSFDLGKEAVNLVGKFDKLRTSGDSASEAIGKIGKDFDLSNVPGIKTAGSVLDKLLADGKLTSEQFAAAWAQALDGKDLAKFEVMARAAFAGTAREGERLGQVMDATVREAVKRTGLDFEGLQGKISAASVSALNDLAAIVNGLDSLQEKGIDTGRVLTASLTKAIDTADGQKALDAVIASIEELRSKLGDKVADGLLDQARQKAEALGDALDKAKPGINSVAEAMKALGITSDESLKRTAATAKEAYEAMAASGTRSARELGEGFKKAAEAAIAANNGIAPSWVESQAAARGYALEVDSAGKTTLRAMGEAKAAVAGVGTAVRDVSASLKQMGIDAATASQQVKDLAAAGQMLAAAEQNRRDVWNSDLEKSKISNRPGMAPVDAVPSFESQEQADAWKKEWQAQYQRDNPFSTRSGGQLGNYMKALTDFEWAKEVDAMKLRNAMKGNGNATNSTLTPLDSMRSGQNTTVTINLNGTSRVINTDSAGATALQDLLSALGDGRGTYQ